MTNLGAEQQAFLPPSLGCADNGCLCESGLNRFAILPKIVCVLTEYLGCQ